LGLPRVAESPIMLRSLAFLYVEDPPSVVQRSLTRSMNPEMGVYRSKCSVSRFLVTIPWAAAASKHPFGQGEPWRMIDSSIKRYMEQPRYELKLGSAQMGLSRTILVGVLNVTPDSFSDGGRYYSHEQAVLRGSEMADQGADIIDVGGESTRPFSDPVTLDEELGRVIPVIEDLASISKVPISVDTRKAEVARRAVEAGATMINDVSGLRDPEMLEAAVDLDLPVVIMHMLGEPKTMQRDIHYEDVMGDIALYLNDRIQAALEAGLKEKNIIVDPGIGFGKELRHNLDIIMRLRELTCLGRPIMIGPSRKTFIGKVLGLPSHQRMEGTLAALVASVLNGADLVRVHDIKESLRVCRMADALLGREG